MDTLTTPQAREREALMMDMARAIEKVGRSLQDLTEKQQNDYAHWGQEVSRLSDRVDDSHRASSRRFMSLAQHYGRGGDYRGVFPDAQTARVAGLAMIAAVATDGARGAAMAELQRAGITPALGSSGGYLMPDMLIDALIRNVEDSGVFERNVTFVPVPVLAGGVPSRTGGLTVYCPDYEEAATASAPTFGRKNFSCKRHCVYPRLFTDFVRVAPNPFRFAA